MCKLSKKAIIAIDGGAGVGKTTVSKLLSKKLGILYVDTGAMYRAVGLYFLNNNIEINSENVEKNIKSINIQLEIINGNNLIFLNGEDVTEYIRTEEVSMAASNISKYNIVRDMLVKKQRDIAGEKSVVIEGRDTASVIFPNADVKIFLISSINVRAKRRYEDLKKKEANCNALTFEKVKEDMIKRDEQDTTRKNAPLIKTQDSIIIDTTNNTIEQTADIILNILNERIGLK